jgi:hypothetical protein
MLSLFVTLSSFTHTLLHTLRYFATGDSFVSLMYLFKISKQFISSMLPGVLKAIIENLQDFANVSFFITLFLKLDIFTQ